MKIISLNAWGGKVDIIQNFIEDEKKDTDIFCFQESLNSEGNIFCSEILKNYEHFYKQKNADDFDNFYQSTFVKKEIKTLNFSTIGEGDRSIGFGLFTQVETPNGVINVCNIHGFARPGDKKDNQSRIRFSQMIIDFLEDFPGPKIICGDFNLDIGTKSVSLFKEHGYKNLIEEFNIETTRNHLAWDNYPNKQLFADHFFINSEIKVQKFSVPNIDISDHLPMILEFEF